MLDKTLKKMKLKKATLAVLVGLTDEDLRKFVIPVSYLEHSYLRGLLDKAYDLYGYQTEGPLRLPCSPDEFLQLKWAIEKGGDGNRNSFHHQIHHSLSLI